MRGFLSLLVAAAIAAAPLSQGFAAQVLPRVPKPNPTTEPHSHHTTGPWIVACGMASAGALMIGTAIKANDPDKNRRRQLTITEAPWVASVCPLVLPFALIAQSLCPDNKATYTVARLAWLYVAKHPASDQSAFTNAYAEACHTGRLSHATLRALRKLI